MGPDVGLSRVSHIHHYACDPLLQFYYSGPLDRELPHASSLALRFPPREVRGLFVYEGPGLSLKDSVRALKDASLRVRSKNGAVDFGSLDNFLNDGVAGFVPARTAAYELSKMDRWVPVPFLEGAKEIAIAGPVLLGDHQKITIFLEYRGDA